MSYVNLIDTSLNRAFNLLKDLAQTGIVRKAQGISYDFGVGATLNTTTDISVKFIVTDNTRDHKDTSQTTRSILLKARAVGELNTNDRLIVGSEVWKFAHVVQSDGYITQAEIVRES